MKKADTSRSSFGMIFVRTIADTFESCHSPSGLLNEDLMILNETVTELTMDLEFAPLSFMKFTMYTQMEESFKMQSVRSLMLYAISDRSLCLAPKKAKLKILSVY